MFGPCVAPTGLGRCGVVRYYKQGAPNGASLAGHPDRARVGIPSEAVSMESKTPLTLPSPPRGEEIPQFAPRLLRPPNSDSFSRGGLLPLPLGKRIEVRGIMRRHCIVTAEVDCRQ